MLKKALSLCDSAFFDALSQVSPTRRAVGAADCEVAF